MKENLGLTKPTFLPDSVEQALQTQKRMQEIIDATRINDQVRESTRYKQIIDATRIDDQVRESMRRLKDGLSAEGVREALKYPNIDQSMATLGTHLQNSASRAFASLARATALPGFALSPAWSSLDAVRPRIGEVNQQIRNSLAITVQIQGVLGPSESVARMLNEMERRNAALTSSVISKSWASLEEMTRAADQTWKTLERNPIRMGRISPALMRSPAVEIYSAARGLSLLRPQADDDSHSLPDLEADISTVADRFGARLESFDPVLNEMYSGASGRIAKGGPDWRRHALISFRELSMHILRKLAPDEEVLPWAKPHHVVRGKITRRARVEFIFREVSGGDLTEFMAQDISAAVELFELLNKVHKKKQTITDAQLGLVRNRIQGLIDTLLEATGN